MRPGDPITERKVKPDGSVREYRCRVALVAGGLLVVRFAMDGAGEFRGPMRFPAGTISYGYFWHRRPYNLYRFTGREGKVLGHRFDAVADVRVAEGAVTYRDLVLDWWVLEGGELVEEDREEFELLASSGGLRARDVRGAEAAARQVYSRYRHAIDEAARVHEKYGLRP